MDNLTLLRILAEINPTMTFEELAKALHIEY